MLNADEKVIMHGGKYYVATIDQFAKMCAAYSEKPPPLREATEEEVHLYRSKNWNETQEEL